jgi:hypothetical protein
MTLSKGLTLAGVITVLSLVVALAAWLAPNPFGIGARGTKEPPTASASTVQPSQPATTVPAPSTKGSTPEGFDVTLRLDEAYDLDTQRKTTVASPSTELSRASYRNMLVNPRGYEFFPLTNDLTEATCRSVIEALDGRDSGFTWDELASGLTFCVPTSESRIAGITVTKRAPTWEGPLTLKVTLW